MEHVNSTTTTRQQQQQQQLQQHQLEQQQQHSENQQQFCLRWHNHQTSLLSTLPVLLDQSHLTDVTISAEGRTLRAHRVVLSACSSFFMELFRTLESNNHPVIIIPGATFGAIVALLTFMYSGEVNVYEEQIPMLLNLAETLGIKGLADVPNNINNNNNNSKRPSDYFESLHKENRFERPMTPPSPPTLLLPNAPTPTPTQTLLSSLSSAQVPPHTPPSLLTNKLAANCTPLENLFLKSLQFYPNLLPQPLNFSQNALNKTTELLAKYQQQCNNLYQGALAKDFMPLLDNDDSLRHTHAVDDNCGVKRFCTREKLPTPQMQPTQNQGTNALQSHLNQQKDIKRIDKIVENLRGPKSSDSQSPQLGISTPPQATTLATTTTPQSMQQYTPPLVMKSSPNYTASGLTISHQQHLYNAKTPLYTTTSTAASLQAPSQPPASLLSAPYITPEDHAKLQQHMEQYAACNREAANAASAATLCATKSEPNLLALTEKLTAPTATANASPIKPPSNSKLYATCFICHKQLSNQYNLRVHLETHQNVRYACNVCSHVSRSKDALRKHVSYRHPGAPSPCETDARRKRVSKLSANLQGAHAPTTVISAESAITAPTTTTTPTGVGYTSAISDAAQLQQLSGSNPYLFLPNQFHLAAAAAAAAAESAAAASSPAMSAAIGNPPQTPPTTALDLVHNTLPTANKAAGELIKKEQNGEMSTTTAESLSSLPTLPSTAS